MGSISTLNINESRKREYWLFKFYLHRQHQRSFQHRSFAIIWLIMNSGASWRVNLAQNSNFRLIFDNKQWMLALRAKNITTLANKKLAWISWRDIFSLYQCLFCGISLTFGIYLLRSFSAFFYPWKADLRTSHQSLFSRLNFQKFLVVENSKFLDSRLEPNS